MKYVIYPIGFVLTGVLFLSVLFGAHIGFSWAWQWAFELKPADAVFAGQMTTCFCVLVIGGLIYASDAA